MLTSDDVINLFSAMRTAYGGQWKHGNEAVSVWRNALARFDANRIQQAMNEALGIYTDHPPTLPQFIAVCKPRPVANTYLPAPQIPRARVVGNRVLMSVLMNTKGVDKFTLTNLVALKNALADEFLAANDDQPTEAYVRDMNKQLQALVQ